MNRAFANRRGSALLVVLGMLAFMVISGLAFSVYMRSTRMPSSFTRRTVATRQLAKAALAEAIDQIDRAVANDPHPGVRNRYRAYLQNPSVFDTQKIDNFWCGRVLVGQGGDTDGLNTQVKVPVNGNVYYPRFVEQEETVPVLTLEALAYMPPPLINDIRYYGQLTPTACWQTFGFDAGRYAYIAVDVSDYFDVNRILAGEPRSSNPARRVTAAHLFETPAHNAAPSSAESWETFMSTFQNVSDDGEFSYGAKIPLVSLADFNLALGSQTLGGMKSAFVQYVANGGGGSGFYGSGPGSDDFENYGKMTFVTDSLEAPLPPSEAKTAAGETVLNLDDDQNQIFTEAFLHRPQEDRPLLSVSSLKTQPFSRLVQNRVPYISMFALSDYLDCDRIPITLGMPSVERVPMICGIKPAVGNARVQVAVRQNEENGGNDKEVSGSMANKDPVVKVQRNVRWRLDAQALAAGFMGGMVQALVVYPFRNHEKLNEGGFFNVDGKVQLFFSSETMRLRTGNADDLLHWSASGTTTSGGDAKLLNAAVMNLPLNAEGVPLKTDVNDPLDDCVYEVNLPLGNAAGAIASELADEKGDFLNVTYEWERNLIDEKSGKYDNDYANELPPAEKITAASSALHALKADGTVDGDFTGLTKESVKDIDKTLHLNFVVTLRVTSSSGEVLGEGSSGVKTVDMVPATLDDDKPLNNIDNSMGLSAAVFREMTGEPNPLMKFDTGASFNLKLDSAATCNAEVRLTPSAVMVDDPRWNHAPENWRELADFSRNGWYAAQTSAANDGDIFMATADQDYLQSVYEFAFLPRCSDLEQYGSAVRGNLAGYPSAANSWIRLCAQAPIDRDLMWKTYDVFGRYSTDGDDFEGLGLMNLGRGLRVNPYSDSASVILAAFANTPHDWRAASENEDENKGADLSVSDFNRKYAWNEYSSGAKFCWDQLEAVADRFSIAVRDGFLPKDQRQTFKDVDYGLTGLNDRYSDVLEDAFRVFAGSSAGTDANRYLCGLELDDDCSSVYSVDKKFLYGYWKSCFAARQQLFLVFFRAEPMMLGGGIAGVTPPQLGAKGVALVWRDPCDPNERRASGGTAARVYPDNENYRPHKTRVLFYRQFE